MGESGASRLPVFGSRSTSLMPLQYEPNDIQRPAPVVLITAGSMALKSSLAPDWTTMPRSVHLYAGSSGSRVGVDASAMADVFTPNFDTE